MNWRSRKVHSLTFSIMLLAILILESAAVAQDCSLTGKKIVYSFTICSFERCSQNQLALTFVGDKVIAHENSDGYNTSPANYGYVYKIGSTIDVLKDDFHAAMRQRHQISEIRDLRHITSASFEGGTLKMKREHEFMIPGAVVISERGSTEIRVVNCKSCIVTSITSASGQASRPTVWKLSEQQCRVQ